METRIEVKIRTGKPGMHGSAGAYFTVEAALLLPFVLAVIVLVIYLWFYQYDRCLLEQDAGVLALRGSVCGISDKEELMQWLEGEAQKTDADKYINWTRKNIEMKLERDALKVKSAGELNYPFANISFWSGENIWKTEVTYKTELVRPVFFVRTYRKLMGGK